MTSCALPDKHAPTATAGVGLARTAALLEYDRESAILAVVEVLFQGFLFKIESLDFDCCKRQGVALRVISSFRYFLAAVFVPFLQRALCIFI